jgi:hypothetical protein
MKSIHVSNAPTLNMPGRREPGIRSFGLDSRQRAAPAPVTVITTQKKG